jgi:NAD(P)-dependent dehydrogenase (short-subunit alcohol dehydrogenase family)
MSAALPHLSKTRGRALFVSTVASEDRPPRRGLALYSATKSALNRVIESWQEEERSVGFTRVTIGDTHATEMASEWDPVATGEIVREWVDKGFLYGRTMDPTDVAAHLVDLLVLRETVPFSSLIPRYPDV